MLLAAVRSTAASWEETGHGNHLDPDLRLWLDSDKAARYVGPPLRRPLALRALRDMQEPDAALLWLAEVESLPLPQVARPASTRSAPPRNSPRYRACSETGASATSSTPR